ncbi:hypothetical protein E2562_006066 [Oryza meyeriana var. granulata]|uniref:KIB1-4 beta-propeller domain-containing protein n=1 Tax=Oryza meyeriana var. granulata TaxID=110450 RepID=A0A6G1EVL1_9ORYZ|nr:hypothetical protein E2562_006066 [Oryza meyeriana var. granulata]
MRRSLAPRRPAMAAAAARNPRNPRRCATIFAELAPFVSFADYLGLRLVDRAWRLYCRRVGHAPPPFPWLLLPEREPPAAAGPRRATARGVFYDIPGGRSYGYQVPSRDVHRCVATGHGWLVMAAVEAQEPRRIVLVNPITDEQRFFAWPFAKWNVRFHAVLTSSPIDEGCFLVVVTDRLLAFCRPDDFQGGWQTLRAPGFRYHAALSDVVSVGSTVYLVDERRRLWRVDLADENPKVQRRDTGFALPSQETRRQYLVESLGHVLLVLSDDRHNRVALYKLNWEARAWLPTASCPGERVLLLGRGCSAAVPSSSAAGRAPGSVLFAYQPSTMPDVDGAVRGVVGGQAWFWSESRVGAVPGDLLVLKKTVSHRHGELPTTGDSFWFFPEVDPDENAR